MTESEVAKLVASIEMEMFDIFRNTDSKYMNKYRTIMFNLKDPRNKVRSKSVKPITDLRSCHSFEYFCQYFRNLYMNVFLEGSYGYICFLQTEIPFFFFILLTNEFFYVGLVVSSCSWRDQSLQIGQDEPEGHAGSQGIRAKCKRNSRGKVQKTLNTTIR